MGVEYYQQSAEQVLASLSSRPAGLTGAEAGCRLRQAGRNELETVSGVSTLRIFLNQFTNFIIYILLFAVIFSLLIGEYIDSIIILVILVLNAAIGFFQELSAHRSLEALRRLAAIHATVIRDGRMEIIDAAEVVEGDLVFLEAGQRVPADARLIEVMRMKVDEAALTGESIPVDKTAATLSGKASPADQRNMVFSSTAVVTGSGRAVVTATGMRTEIGRITALVKQARQELTPLQLRLDRFGRLLGQVIIGICVCVLLLTSLRAYLTTGLNTGLLLSFLFVAISLAVAAVPTALPAVVTIALSIGVKRLLRKKALVRRLSAVETLGSCDVICTDKTGTLTENQMTVRYAWTPAGEIQLTGYGYDPHGECRGEPDPLLFHTGLLCNNSSLFQEGGAWNITGDPTEAALLVSARKAGVSAAARRLDEIPFDSGRKCMSVLAQEAGTFAIYTKGAPGQVLDLCDRILVNGQAIPLGTELRRQVLAQTDRYARDALRVLAFAFRRVSGSAKLEEQNLVFIGLQAMIDPPRPDVADSIRRTRNAGIRVIMVTGDYLETARAIGREIGIDGNAVTGEDLENLDGAGLRRLLQQGTNIFARVVPEHKQMIIAGLQQMGHTVAMTGDGVNDAPALKKADIGIAVGSGTEVAREASDFILLDDSYTHIVNAIEEGRGIYDNIQKSIMLLLSGNVGEVLIIFAAVLVGFNLPLTAILLLWINMVTDGAPALAFSVDPYGRDIMHRLPKPRDEPILPPLRAATILTLGAIGTLIALALFAACGGNSGDQESLVTAQTMVFNFVVLYECILVFVIRRSYDVPLYANSWMWLAVAASLLLQALLMYTPLYRAFQIVPLTWQQLTALGSAGLAFLGCGRLCLFLLNRIYAPKNAR